MYLRHTSSMLVFLISPACALYTGTLGLHTYQCQLTAMASMGGSGPTYTASVTTEAGGTCGATVYFSSSKIMYTAGPVLVQANFNI